MKSKDMEVGSFYQLGWRGGYAQPGVYQFLGMGERRPAGWRSKGALTQAKPKMAKLFEDGRLGRPQEVNSLQVQRFLAATLDHARMLMAQEEEAKQAASDKRVADREAAQAARDRLLPFSENGSVLQGGLVHLTLTTEEANHLADQLDKANGGA